MSGATPDIRSLTIPNSLEAPEAPDFVEMVRVRNIVYAEISGNRDEELTPDVLLPYYQPSAYESRLLWSVHLDDECVGRAGLDLPHVLVAAARHLPSGRLVAFTELASTPGHPVAHQEDTLVLREHRGHRLGMRLKTAALQRWHEDAPHTQRILTYNAEENRPMLDVNEAMGFVPVAYIGAWKKTLNAASEAAAGTADRNGSTDS